MRSKASLSRNWYQCARNSRCGRGLQILTSIGHSGETERSFRKESERHSGIIPNTIGASRRWHLDCAICVRLRQEKPVPERDQRSGLKLGKWVPPPEGKRCAVSEDLTGKYQQPAFCVKLTRGSQNFWLARHPTGRRLQEFFGRQGKRPQRGIAGLPVNCVAFSRKCSGGSVLSMIKICSFPAKV